VNRPALSGSRKPTIRKIKSNGLKTRVIASPFNSARGRHSARPASLADQLQEQLRSERAQHRFNLAEKERELTAALRELAEARYEIAKRDRKNAFSGAPSPSTSLR
jgi:Skp family chaperone for outer membrane proteins